MKQKNITAMDRALTYIGYKNRTVQEIRNYLKEKAYSEKVITETVDKLKDYGYLGDERYVKIVCQNNAVGNRYGKNRIIRDLKQRGIAESLLEKVARWLENNGEEANAEFHYRRAYRKYDRYMPKKKKEKIAQYLTRQGFSWETVQNQFDLFWNNEKEENLLDPQILNEMVSKTAERILNKKNKRPLKKWEYKNKIMQSLAMKGVPTREIYRLVDLYFEENWEEFYEDCHN